MRVAFAATKADCNEPVWWGHNRIEVLHDFCVPKPATRGRGELLASALKVSRHEDAKTLALAKQLKI